MKYYNLYIVLSFILISISSAYSQDLNRNKVEELKSLMHSGWVDSVYNSLSLEDRIAQLFWIPVNAYASDIENKSTLDLVSNYHPGGVLYFKSEPEDVVRLTNRLQQLSKVPLIMSLDAEWGPGMRFPGTFSFPYQMTLGAIDDDNLIYLMGKENARQLKRLGIQVNFAPVVDVNNNIHNPVISYRSFGEDPLNVAQKAVAYMNGLQDNGIMAVAKHFPGHGDTNKDSHKTLPLIKHSRARIDSIELVPFKEMIRNGVMGIMSAHLEIPSLEPIKGLPASISKNIVTGLLRNELGYEGVVITDAMNMKGVTIADSPGRVDAKALIAGNDIVEYTADLPKAIEEVKLALKSNLLSLQDIENKCRKALALKEMLAVNKVHAISDKNISEDINSPSANLLLRLLYENSVTCLRNKSVLPIKELAGINRAVVVVGDDQGFSSVVNRYAKIDVYNLTVKSSIQDYQNVWGKLKNRDEVIVALTDTKALKPNKITASMKRFLDDLLTQKRTIIAFVGMAYHLDYLESLKNVDGLIITYQNQAMAQDVAAQALFGAVGCKGKLPVTVNNYFRLGDGLKTEGNLRLGYAPPEAVGLNSYYIQRRVDSVISLGLKNKAFPGCQVLVAQQGKVIFNQAYGYHTYDSILNVKVSDLYDIASVTKIIGPLPLLMKLCDEGVIDINQPMSKYWSDWKSSLFHHSNKDSLILSDILAHQAGLKPYVAYWNFWKGEDAQIRRSLYRENKGRRYALQADEQLWLKNSCAHKVYKAIRKSSLAETTYHYSGLAFMIFPKMISDLTKDYYPDLLDRDFFQPLGASSLGYRPLKHVLKEQVVPTEIETDFRAGLKWGYVHDGAAACLGGISGNAGLFSNANDLAKLLQMYLNQGIYGGRRYLSKEVIELFTQRHFVDNNNRRGLGFDKPVFGNDTLCLEKAYPAPGVSDLSYGHSGYTGTFVWIDPQYDLLYIFLSNRVHPTSENKGIYKYNIRLAVQQVFYDAMNYPYNNN